MARPTNAIVDGSGTAVMVNEAVEALEPREFAVLVKFPKPSGPEEEILTKPETAEPAATKLAGLELTL